MKKGIPLLAVAGLVMAACGRNEPVAEAPPAATSPGGMELTATGAATPAAARVQLESRSNSTAVGELEFSASDGSVSITGELAGLTPGKEHAFHVHEVGDCSAPDATSAGSHFNPAGAPHGPPTVAPNERHVGDMPNLLADAQGRATVTASIMGATLRDGGPNDLIGRAVIVHADRDDYVTQPTGNAGGRIACGVIR